MIPFYYKGILIYQDAMESVYSKAIREINNLSSLIRSETWVGRLYDKNIDYDLTISIAIENQYLFIIQLNPNMELYGVYNKDSQRFENLTVDRLINILPKARTYLPIMSNRYLAAIDRGEKPSICNLLSDNIKNLWERHKDNMIKSGIDIISRTVDAELVQSCTEYNLTTGELESVLDRIESEKDDYVK